VATEYRRFPVTIPAGTLPTAGFTFDLSFPARIVTQVNIRFPPGPRGEVGAGVGNSGVVTIPYGNTQMIITDNEDLQFPLDQAVESGSWTFFGYNTGQYDHTIQVLFYLDPIPAVPTLGGGALPITDTGTGTGTTSGGGGGGTPGGCVDQYGNIVDCPPGTPPGSVVPVTPIPPITTPPPIAPPAPPTAPVTLPPITSPPPGLGAGPAYGSDDPLLIAVPDLGQVWVLDAESYRMVADQDSADALLNAGMAAASISSAAHQSILMESAGHLSVSLGHELLGGAVTYQR
jgi:hypothetical protein